MIVGYVLAGALVVGPSEIGEETSLARQRILGYHIIYNYLAWEMVYSCRMFGTS